jgi:uncharacterized protein YqjF (DUF2071 family)
MFNVSSVLNETAHRPWSLPTTPWLMTNIWKSLLFAHWPVEVEQLKRFIPRGLELDLWEGQAWLGIVPFEMSYQLRYSPWAVRFGELNVRTYVTYQGKPGVLFLSLDASDLFTVYMARLTYSLPYYSAKIQFETIDSEIHYQSQRSKGHAAFQGRYKPVSDPFESTVGSLEHWLTERYCLYAKNSSGVLCRGNIHHLPWQLQKGEAVIKQCTMADIHGIQLPDRSPVLHYAESINVVIWPLETLKG